MSLCCIRSFTCPCPVSPTRRQSFALIVAHRSGLYCNIVPDILFVNIKSILFMIFSNPAFLSSVVRYSTLTKPYHWNSQTITASATTMGLLLHLHNLFFALRYPLFTLHPLSRSLHPHIRWRLLVVAVLSSFLDEE